MKIRPLVDLLTSTAFFKTVEFTDNVPDIEELKDINVPAVFILPASARGGGESGSDLSLQQERLEVYSFCLVVDNHTEDGTEEPLDDAIQALSGLIFGYQFSPQYSPFALGEGDMFEKTTRNISWVETYITRHTLRQ